MTAEHEAEHAAPSSGSLRDDLRNGVRFALARRKKILGYTVAAALYLVTNGLVHGQAQAVCNVIITVGGFVGVYVPRIPPPRSPRPKD